MCYTAQKQHKNSLTDPGKPFFMAYSSQKTESDPSDFTDLSDGSDFSGKVLSVAYDGLDRYGLAVGGYEVDTHG